MPETKAAPTMTRLRAWPIVAGLFGGLVLGGALHALNANTDTATSIAQLVGSLWLNALRMTLVPLIFSLVVTGIAAAASNRAGGQLGRRTGFLFVSLLLLSAFVGVVLGSLLLDMGPAASIAAVKPNSVELPEASAWILGLVPSNIVSSAADGAIVPLVLFALIFALAAVRLGDRASQVLGFFEAVSEIMVTIVHWVLFVAPIGVFALAFSLGATTGFGAGAFVGWYVVVQIIATLLLAAFMYPLAVKSGLSFGAFSRAAAPAQAVAASTQSSLASLPLMVEAAERLGLPEKSAAVVLPLAVAVFRIAAPASIVIVTLALSRIMGVELGWPQLAIVMLMATLNTLVIAGLPNQITFFAAYAPPALAVGVPVELLPIFLAIDAIPDIFYTVTNVTADLAVTSAVSGGPSAPPTAEMDQSAAAPE